MSTSITSNVVEDIIKKNYIFNNIILASKSCIIKVSPKSDMAIVWMDIWCYKLKILELVKRKNLILELT